MSRRNDGTDGRFEVTGPWGEPRGCADIGHGLSIAQARACERLGEKSDSDRTWYVREWGTTVAYVTLHPDGTVSSWEA